MTANDRDDRDDLRDLAETEASLRRIAMLVAEGVAPQIVFDAVTKEALGRFGFATTARMIRFESDGTATILANDGTSGAHVNVGKAWESYPPTGLTATIQRTAAPARVEDYGDIPGGEPYLREGLRCSVGMPIHVTGRLWGMIAVGFAQGPLPPDAEVRMTEFTDLLSTAIATAHYRAELIASRARLVAAADEARRRITRDLHDGAQQRVVALALRLRSAAEYCTDLDAARDSLRAAVAEAFEVGEDLREIAQGIHPAILSEAGLGPALRALGRRSAIPTTVRIFCTDRLPTPIEVCAFYVVSEMLTNAAKHSQASVIRIDARIDGGRLRISVRDDGIGGANPAGSGITGLRDRVEAFGGTLEVDSECGQGTIGSCDLPTTLPSHTGLMGSATPPFQPPTASCAIERAMAVIWDHWSMLILREIHSGVAEFDALKANLIVDEKVLTVSLEKLVAAGVLETRECGEPGDRLCPGYYLTSAGRDLSVVLGALQQWGDAHLPLPRGRSASAPIGLQEERSPYHSSMNSAYRSTSIVYGFTNRSWRPTDTVTPRWRHDEQFVDRVRRTAGEVAERAVRVTL